MADMGPRATGSARRRGPSAAVSAALVVGLAIIAFGVVWWLWAANDGVLVITPPGVAVREGQEVSVTGTVRIFEYEPGLGEADDFGDYDDARVVIARQVVPLAGDVEEELDLGDDVVVGRQVRLVGEVEEIVGLRSFILDE